MADRAIEAREQRPLRRYSNVAVAFHWVTALWCCSRSGSASASPTWRSGPEQANLFTWHRTIGALILLLVLARLTYRLFNPPPPYPPDFRAGSGIAGTWNHRLFYLLLIAMPIGGLAGGVRRMTKGATITLLGGDRDPQGSGHLGRNSARSPATIHVAAAWLLIALIVAARRGGAEASILRP